MSDSINRQDAIYALLEKGQRSRRYKLGEIWELNFDEIREALATVPSAEPVRHGKWIYGEHDIAMCDGYRCSNCGYFVPWDYSHKSIDYIEEYKYCPQCGARMDEE